MSGGAYSRDKGARAEQHLAKFLRQWWPKAERAVRTGYRTAERVSADPGDIAGVPGVIWSCKHVNPRDAAQPAIQAKWWAELDAMLDNDPAALGILVERRDQAPDPTTWWAHLRLGDLVALYKNNPTPTVGDRTPARVSLQTLVELLLAAGYARDGTRETP